MEIVESRLFGIRKQRIAGWHKAIPHVGFERDMVWCVRHTPVSDRVAVWRKLANDPTTATQAFLKFVEDYLKASEASSEREKEELRREFKKFLAANLTSLIKKGAFRLIGTLFDIVKKDYGHHFIAFRKFGEPVARYGNARQIGFYPRHLCERIDDGIVTHCDESLSPQRRVIEMLHYDRDYPGGISNDDTEKTDICAIVKLTHVQFVNAIPVIRRAANKFYYSFNQRRAEEDNRVRQNCVGFGPATTDLLRVEIPDALRVNMPAELAVIMEKLAVVDPFETSKSPIRFIPRAEMAKRNAAALAEFQQNRKLQLEQPSRRLIGPILFYRKTPQAAEKRFEAA